MLHVAVVYATICSKQSAKWAGNYAKFVNCTTCRNLFKILWYLHGICYYLIRTFVYLELWAQPETRLLRLSLPAVFGSILSLSLSVSLGSSLFWFIFVVSSLPGPGQPHASSNDAQLKAENADAAKKSSQLRCRRWRRRLRRRWQLRLTGVCSALE